MARLLDGIVGHQKIIEKLLGAKKENRLPTTFLFVGPRGVGKKTVAFALAQALVCEKNPIACGECGPCLRIAKGQSEGLLFIEPEKTQIKMEQSRDILDFLSLRSVSKSRIVIVDAAESLNAQAANSLLKILEEPPADSYFFLIAPSSKHVLPTIRSRAQIVAFSPLSLEEMRSKSQAPEWALLASQGSFSRLANLQESEELEIRNQAETFLEMWFSDRRSYLSLEWRNLVRDRIHALSMIRHLLLLLRDVAFMQAGNKEILNPDKKNILSKLTQIDPRQIQAAGQRMIHMEGALLANRDVQLVFEEFWLRDYVF